MYGILLLLLSLLLYLSAHVQHTRQTLGIAPHEALFKKKQTNTHTQQVYWDATKNCWPSHKSLLPHLSDRHPHSFSLHAPSKIIANFPSSSAASNSLPLWVLLTLPISSSLSSCHLAHFRRKCFASSTSCPLYIFSLLYLPLSIYQFQCAGVPSLLLA